MQVYCFTGTSRYSAVWLGLKCCFLSLLTVKVFQDNKRSISTINLLKYMNVMYY